MNEQELRRMKATLLEHHGYSNTGIKNHSPIALNDFCLKADVSESIAEEFFGMFFADIRENVQTRRQPPLPD